MMIRKAVGFLQITGAVVLLAGMGQAQKITYTRFQLPNSTFTEAIGINNAGDVVGWYNQGFPTQGFLYSGGVVTEIADPSADAGTTAPIAINTAGAIVGTYTNSRGRSQAFLDVNGVFSDIQAPGTVSGSDAAGINNLGQIVGMYYDVTGPWHGYFFDSVTLKFKTIDIPGAPYTWAQGINDNGLMVLSSLDSNNVQHAWLYNGKTFTNIDVPGYANTVPEGINNQGMVTLIATTKAGLNYGFVYRAGQFTAVNPPGATSVSLRGINDLGEIVGNYTFASGNQGSFLAKLPQQ
ncbi:MAG TPA: hypothetical protein VGM18_01230 [Candidatus Sulfotelmatobacter sp.]|jgi:probable HAF family extracellular repeat protein